MKTNLHFSGNEDGTFYKKPPIKGGLSEIR